MMMMSRNTKKKPVDNFIYEENKTNNKNKMHNSKKAQHERKSDDLLNVLIVRWENKYSC